MPRPNGYCRTCRKPVLRAVTQAGRIQDLNPEPDPAGNTAVYRDAPGTWRARRPTTDDPVHPWERIHMPHAATCTGVPPLMPTRHSPAVLPEGVVSLAAHRRKRHKP